MRILFATTPHLPEVGGAQITNHWLAMALSARGHDVIVFASRPTQAARTTHEPHGEYLTIGSSDPARQLPPFIASFAPDWVVAGGHDQHALRSVLGQSRARTLLYLHDLSALKIFKEPDLVADRVAAVSRWLADRAKREGVAAAYVPPIVERARYRVATTRRVALLVNPTPVKGLDIALSLAHGRPDISFALVPSWGVSERDLRELRGRVFTMPNVEIRDPTPPGGGLFSDCRALLVPSRLPESWARVASEAQSSGIPVVASSHGGLPEAVGAGGILVPPAAPASTWASALSHLWDDPRAYSRYATLAEHQGRRTDLEPDCVVRRFEAVLEG